jgi:quinolinate synthase
MRKNNPDKEFIVVPMGDNCSCADCSYMKLNTLEKLYNCLRDETPEILMSDELIEQARKPIVRMLDMSKQLGIIK